MIEAYDSTLSRCLQGKSAPCATACPFSLPIREFLEKLARGSFAAAARMYRSAVLFPGDRFGALPGAVPRRVPRAGH